ncbi:unnamed protein product (mitochondrion) [Plasmodiophora brassicae]|uniref:Uncharacterized protein n=1 Tax=Plasmodiophora brassicae TaxID=37360 RepID=A0A3P3YIP2_PLABS|nr:unnamed protein product [Plasmodiophora brassicae]
MATSPTSKPPCNIVAVLVFTFRRTSCGRHLRCSLRFNSQPTEGRHLGRWAPARSASMASVHGGAPRSHPTKMFTLAGCRRRKPRTHHRGSSSDSLSSPSSDPSCPYRTPVLTKHDDHDDEGHVEGLAHRFVFPPHAAKNPFIFRGFKAPETWRHAMNTLFHCDNETANVWSSLFGILPLSFLAVNVLAIEEQTGFDADGLFVAMMLFLGNIVLTSAYHLFNQVPHLYALWSNLDFAGINLAICSLSFAMTYYGYQLWTSMPWYMEFGVVMAIAATCSSAATYYRTVTDHDPFILQPINLTALFFVLTSFFYTMPPSPRNTCFLTFIGIGAFIHVTKIPERWSPGTFCFFGHSHMIWHLSYTMGFFCFYSSIVREAVGPGPLWDEPIFDIVAAVQHPRQHLS